jgi:hypothetical protein
VQRCLVKCIQVFCRPEALFLWIYIAQQMKACLVGVKCAIRTFSPFSLWFHFHFIW